MVEVDHHPQADVGVGLVEVVEHRQEGFIEPLGEEGHLLGAHADRLDARLSQGRQPFADVLVGEHHRVAAGHQDLAQLLSAGRRVDAAVVLDLLVVRLDVGDHVLDLGQPLLGDSPVLALDVLACDQLFAVAEPAV